LFKKLHKKKKKGRKSYRRNKRKWVTYSIIQATMRKLSSLVSLYNNGKQTSSAHWETIYVTIIRR
jgi:hypothetical protein